MTEKIDVGTICNLCDWALFHGVDFIVTACQNYFTEGSNQINIKSILGVRLQLSEFYHQLAKSIDIDALKKFDAILASLQLNLQNHREWELFRRQIVKAAALQELLRVLGITEEIEDIIGTASNINTFMKKEELEESLYSTIKKVYFAAYPGSILSASTDADLNELLNILNKGKISRKKIQENLKQKNALKCNLFEFLRGFETSHFPVPVASPNFYHDPTTVDKASELHMLAAFAETDYTDEQRATLHIYDAASGASGGKNTPESTAHILQQVRLAASNLVLHNEKHDPLPLVLKETSQTTPAPAREEVSEPALGSAIALRTRHQRLAGEEAPAARQQRANKKRRVQGRQPVPMASEALEYLAGNQEYRGDCGETTWGDKSHPENTSKSSRTASPARGSSSSNPTTAKANTPARKPITAVVLASEPSAANTVRSLTLMATTRVVFTDDEDEGDDSTRGTKLFDLHGKIARKSLLTARLPKTSLSGRDGRRRIKWNEDEDRALLEGLARHGHGNWRLILNDEEFSGVLSLRTNINLKDRVRTLAEKGMLPEALMPERRESGRERAIEVDELNDSVEETADASGETL